MRPSPDQNQAALAVAGYLSGAAHGRARTAQALRLRGPGAFRELLLLTLCTVLPALGVIELFG